MRASLLWITTLVSLAGPLVACGSEFSSGSGGSGPGGTGVGAGGAGAGGSGTGAGGTGVGAGGAGAGGAQGGSGGSGGNEPPVCDVLLSGATDLYVDQRFQGQSPTGTETCPFQTINAGVDRALQLGGTITIHVAGSTPALTYAEPDRVIVRPNITLAGDGEAFVHVSASGTCASDPCAVHVLPGGKLRGVTVLTPATNGNGILAGPTVAPAVAPVVSHVAVVEVQGNGILAFGALELGPGVVASHNGTGTNSGCGVLIHGPGRLHVLAPNGHPNLFNANHLHGIDVLDGAELAFEGGETRDNLDDGIRLDPLSAQPPLAHTVVSLTATGNTHNGLAAYGGTLKLRASTLLQNGSDGLAFNYEATTSLDIGTPDEAGNNVFDGPTAATRNGRAGVFLCTVAGSDVQQAAEGDQWWTCPPTKGTANACNQASLPQSDIVIAAGGATVADPLTCGYGP